MLQNSALFFSRSDLIGDPFEGSLPVLNSVLRAEALQLQGGVPAEKAEQVSQVLGAATRLVRRWIYLNCWHMNEHESAAMWKLYAAGQQAIAIRSSYRRLRHCLPSNVHVGVVRYIDFVADTLPVGNTFSPYAYKRSSFAHEHELRAVLSEGPPIVDGVMNLHADNPKHGAVMPVALGELIEVVYVAPTLPEWFAETVEGLTRKYSLPMPVIRSAMDRSPMY
jgi:hypothetical protein